MMQKMSHKIRAEEASKNPAKESKRWARADDKLQESWYKGSLLRLSYWTANQIYQGCCRA
jgi:hypothetical protein